MMKIQKLFRLPRFVPLQMAAILCLLLAGATKVGHAQIGTGWTEYTPTLSYDVPPNGAVRHTFANGIHHFWVLKSDPDTFPGRDTGPRSEAHVHNDYSTGQRQFQADINVEAGSNWVSLVQIFGGGGCCGVPGRATAFMMWAKDQGFTYYSGTPFFKPTIGVYNRVNIIHNTKAQRVDVYVNGSKVLSVSDGGPHTHYNKFGVYGRPQMGQFNGAFFRNVRFFMKP